MGAEEELIARLKAVFINNTLASTAVFYHNSLADKDVHTLVGNE